MSDTEFGASLTVAFDRLIFPDMITRVVIGDWDYEPSEYHMMPVVPGEKVLLFHNAGDSGWGLIKNGLSQYLGDGTCLGFIIPPSAMGEGRLYIENTAGAPPFRVHSPVQGQGDIPNRSSWGWANDIRFPFIGKEWTDSCWEKCRYDV